MFTLVNVLSNTKKISFINFFRNLNIWLILLVSNITVILIALLLKFILPTDLANMSINYKNNLFLVPFVVASLVIISKLLFKNSIYFKLFIYSAIVAGLASYSVYLLLFLVLIYSTLLYFILGWL